MKKHNNETQEGLDPLIIEDGLSLVICAVLFSLGTSYGYTTADLSQEPQVTQFLSNFLDFSGHSISTFAVFYAGWSFVGLLSKFIQEEGKRISAKDKAALTLLLCTAFEMIDPLIRNANHEYVFRSDPKDMALYFGTFICMRFTGDQIEQFITKHRSTKPSKTISQKSS